MRNSRPSAWNAIASTATGTIRFTLPGASQTSQLLSERPFKKDRTYTSRLQKVADAKGFVLLEKFRPGDIDRYFTESPLGPRSEAKMLDWLRSFWRFAAHREWVARSPVSRDLKPPAGSTRAANKMPFTDEQLADTIEVCDRINDFASLMNASSVTTRTRNA